MPKLITFKRDWSDEFDVYGARIMSDEEYNLWAKAVDSVRERPFEYYFGTNEGWDYDTVEDFLDSMKTSHISDDESSIIKCFFHGIGSPFGYGHFPDPMADWDENDDTPETKVYWEWRHRA